MWEKNMTKGKNYFLNYMLFVFLAPSCTKTRIHFGYTLYWEISIIIMYAWDSLIWSVYICILLCQHSFLLASLGKILKQDNFNILKVKNKSYY